MPLPIRRIKSIYEPSIDAFAFHAHPATYRYLLWGVKGGKTRCGSREFTKMCLAKPGCLAWLVAPSYQQLQAAEYDLLNYLHQLGVYKNRNKVKHWIWLKNGVWIQGRSADWPDNLRGPNVDIIWADELAFMKEDAWWILLERRQATRGAIIGTTTPGDRGWFWTECQAAGLPASQDYGAYESEDQTYFVSHYPTWHFPWVDKKDIDRVRVRMPKMMFDREYGALFMTDENAVFRHVDEATHYELPKPENERPEHVLGLDLAKWQDWTAVVIMDARGIVRFVDRWHLTDWTVQRIRVVELAKKWNASVIIDRSNVGSMFEEELAKEVKSVTPMDMNSAQVKNEIIQALQIAFEQHTIKLPDYRTEWSSPQIKHMHDELKWYELTLTRGGRISYSSPKGLTDDIVIALALANWGKVRGLAGAIKPITVVSDNKFQPLKMKRPEIFPSIFSKRKNVLGMGEYKPLFRRR